VPFFALVAALFPSSPALSQFLRRTLTLASLFPAWACAHDAAPPPPPACSLQAHYPLPAARGDLRALAQRQREVADERGCLKDPYFHAWRGATLLALGRPAEAVEPLERALLENPDLPGAELDLAQALAQQGDLASARAIIESMRERPDLPPAIAATIDRDLKVLSRPPFFDADVALAAAGWHSRWQLSSLAGVDTNLNNAPASSDITLTFPEGNVTLPLDVASQPRRGTAILSAAQWQGLRPQGDSLWVLQAELRARDAAQADVRYQQVDVAAAWLQAPAAPRQWVARVASSHLRYGGTSLLHTDRASLQYQWPALGSVGGADWWAQAIGACRPTATGELEFRRYPSSQGLNGLYEGGAVGVLCRGASREVTAGADASSVAAPLPAFYGLQVRLGDEHPQDDARPGGTYRRAEVRAQWEGPLFERGRVGLQWTSTRQSDSEPYSALLGNLPRRTVRHMLEAEASWPLYQGLSLVANAQAALQRSNLPVFASRQRSFYLGLRWELMH
jgi:tetratricopeptide (TPR) repeat protein